MRHHHYCQRRQQQLLVTQIVPTRTTTRAISILPPATAHRPSSPFSAVPQLRGRLDYARRVYRCRICRGHGPLYAGLVHGT
jgi:hypothetical protein